MNLAFNRRGFLAGSLATTALLSSCQTIRSPVSTGLPPGKIQKSYVNGRFGQIHLYQISPKSPTQTPLMLFHPTAASGAFYEDFMKEMGRDRHVMAMDTPGYGKSDAPPAPQSMSAYAGAAADALEALGFGSGRKGAVDVAGYHTGCFIASELAIARPDLVRRLVLPGIPYYEEKQRQAYYDELTAPVTVDPDGKGVQDVWDFWVKGRDPKVPLARGVEHFTDHMQSYPRSNWAYAGVFSYDAERRFPLITQPVLIPNTHGSLEQSSRQAAAFLNDVKVVELPGLDKGVFDIGVDALSRHSREFLDS